MTPEALGAADIGLLTRIGFMAAGASLPRQATAIFESLALLRPRRAFAYIGMATLQLNAGQAEAAVALGFSNTQAMFKIILPQAWRRVLPVLASTWVALFKDTSLVSVIAVGELAHASMTIRSQTFRVLEMLTAMAVIYWMLGYPQAKLVDWIREKYKVNE